MVYDEEPPALSSSMPPQAAFGKRASTGGPPPPSMFSSSTAPSRSAPAAPATDLSSRWKQYEAEKTTGMVGPDGPSSSSASSNAAHSDYDLYETPEKQRKSYTGARGNSASSDANLPEALEPRRTYSLTKSGSYNTNDLIAKYSGVSGVPSSSSGIQRTLSNASSNNGNTSGNGNSNRSHSAIPSSARAEAVKVLTMADEREQRIHHNTSSSSSSNQPFQVHRTESGGFRASAAAAEPERSSFSFQRSSSNTRRTPSALSGLGLNKSSPDRSSAAWKTGRYAFSDPQFRKDDYLEEEEDNIIGPAVVDSLEAENESRKNRTSASYRDFPRGGKATGSSWSSRYSDDPSGAANNTGATLLDRYDRAHSLGQAPTKSSSRKSAARSMFMSTASNVGGSVRALKANVSKGLSEAKSNSKVFGKGFSFKENQKTKLRSPAAQHRKGGADATGVTNLRTVWNDDTFNDEEETSDHKHHRTWEAVALQKQRRRKLLLSFLCVLLSAIIIGVSLSQTAWRWKYKNLWRNGNTHIDVIFYATSNTPLGYGTSEAQLVQDLRNIPSDAEFVTHLGNLQDASLGMCPAARMPEIAGLLAGQSPVPIYMVPGEHDWINCPDQLASLARWLASFGTNQAFEQANSLVDGGTTTAASAGEFDRPKSSPDIFSKLHHGVLFFGLHLVSGIVTEGQGMVVQDVRDEKMAIFVRGTLDRLKGEYRAIVMLGNARPGPQQRNFFDSIREDLKHARVPAAYVHSHSGFGNTEHYPFGGRDVLGSMVAIQASNGGANQTPLKIKVGFGKKPFEVGNDSD